MRRAPGFWARRGPLAWALSPIGAIYGQVTAWRMGRPGQDAPVPVICIGNFVAGGAGKTPTALAAAAALIAAGRHPVFLSRGYGGSIAVPTLVRPVRHGAAEVGDEPLLLAACAPTIVARDRPSGAALAAALGDVIIMDDGLQNPSLRKTLAIAVVDGGAGVGNGLCVPAGPLRAPLHRQLTHVDAVLVIEPRAAADPVLAAARAAGKKVLTATLQPDPLALARIRMRPVLAFAGIGRPTKFFDTLQANGVVVRETRTFPDHHAYGQADWDSLALAARARGLTLVTTEKDRVRLTGFAAATDSPALLALPVSLAPNDPETWRRLLLSGLPI